jgi:hypothetical protein
MQWNRDRSAAFSPLQRTNLGSVGIEIGTLISANAEAE